MKIHIVGGGPAGSIAALSSMNEGYDPIISEEHKKIGIPTNCSGLFSKSGLESLGEFIDYKKLILNEFNGAIFDFAGIKFEVEKNSPVAFSLNRAALDQQLASKVESKGGKINYGERINGKFHSDIIVGADGPGSFVAHKFGFEKLNVMAATYQTFAKYKAKDPKKVEVYYSNEIFGGFFGWVIPVDEYNVEIGCGAILPSNAKRAFDLFIKKLNVIPNEVHQWAIPLKTREKTGKVVGNKKIILVGDAAGQTKSTTGGGIILGGNCAKIAGLNVNDPIKYEKEWRKKFGLEFKLHYEIQNFLGSRSDSSLRILGKTLNTFKFGNYLSKNGDMDLPTKLIKPDLITHLIKAPFIN